MVEKTGNKLIRENAEVFFSLIDGLKENKDNLVKLDENKYYNLIMKFILLKFTSYKTEDEFKKYYKLKDKIVNTYNYNQEFIYDSKK